jgi:outer membrane protein OmpA-like peptidoglycan-associated protein
MAALRVIEQGTRARVGLRAETTAPRAPTRGTRLAAAIAALGILAGCSQGDDAPRSVGRGTAIGAAIGAALGGGVGLAMDRQRRDFERQLAAERAENEVQIEQLRRDVLVLTLDSEVQFATGSAEIQPGLTRTLDKVAAVIRQHPGMAIAVIGHTDSIGATAFNQRLSEQRAAAVRDALVARGVPAGQLTTTGRGYHEPRAENVTPEGRAANRRVELVLVQPARA